MRLSLINTFRTKREGLFFFGEILLNMSGYAPLFLLNNRAMMGFGTDELTIFQIAKELVDNAVDSIRQLALSEEICETKSIHLLIDTSCVDENRGLVRIER